VIILKDFNENDKIIFKFYDEMHEFSVDEDKKETITNNIIYQTIDRF